MIPFLHTPKFPVTIKHFIISFFLLILICNGCGSTSPAYNMEIHFLNVGQGLSILVLSEDEVLLYDGGDQAASSFVVSYLKEQGISKIDYLISSHYDSDHVSGLIGCLYAFDVEMVMGANYIHDSKLYTSFHEAIRDEGLEMAYPQIGDTYSIGSGSFTILSSGSLYEDSNNNSITLKLTNGEHDFLFMGDAEYSCEKDIITSGLDLSCDVLCLGHHGSASSTSWDFLQASLPEYAIVSCGANNVHGHPHEETMEKLESMEISCFRTDLQDNIIVQSNGVDFHFNVTPCNQYTSGNHTYFPQNSETSSKEYDEVTYILNLRSKVFHSPDCSSISKMSEKNKDYSYDSKENLIEMGYTPCGSCNP